MFETKKRSSHIFICYVISIGENAELIQSIVFPSWHRNSHKRWDERVSFADTACCTNGLIKLIYYCRAVDETVWLFDIRLKGGKMVCVAIADAVVVYLHYLFFPFSIKISYFFFSFSAVGRSSLTLCWHLL